MKGPSSICLGGRFISWTPHPGGVMKRTIVLIDGGHLRALATNAGQNYTPDFIERFATSVLATDEEPLRVLYYDCAPYQGQQPRPVSGDIQTFNKSDGWLTDLAGRDLFAVRLGVLKWRGWKPRQVLAQGQQISDADFKPDFEQKGVDLKIGLDIATYSLNRSVERIILVTGDTDLIPAMKLARRCGVQLVGIDLPNRRQSAELRSHVDLSRSVGWPGP